MNADSTVIFPGQECKKEPRVRSRLVEAPDFSPRKSTKERLGFSPGGMHFAPQEIRTFFITSVASGRRNILQSDRMARLLIDVLQDNRKKGRFFLHEFVIMPNHFHLLITPAHDVPLAKVVQYIKGGFSFRVKKELSLNYAVWQESFTDHRIRDAEDYANHKAYIIENPVRAKLVPRAELFPYSSAYPGTEVDAVPPGLKPVYSTMSTLAQA